MRLRHALGAGAVLATCLTLAVSVAGNAQQDQPPGKAPVAADIHLIKHIIIITQENRSYDAYFGTYPGADGIPPSACAPDPGFGGCIKPFVDHKDSNRNDPHGNAPFVGDVDNGKMDGFVRVAQQMLCPAPKHACYTDVMGHHVASDIPNYWSYAKHFVLMDHQFESVDSWSLPSHLYEVSGWSATCTKTGVPSSCHGSTMPKERTSSDETPFAWTDITWLLNKNHVRWGYYLDHGGVSVTGANPNGVSVHFNPLPGFTDVHKDKQMGSVRPLTVFYAQAKAGTLPSVSWVAPDFRDSEHPPALVSTGQAYVTRVINAVMRSSDWSSTAIFLSWDDWGGFYDNVKPPTVDKQGYGIRVPGIIISPYAKPGFVFATPTTQDAYLKFIEDDFLNGARLNPKTDGRPDPRPDVRESSPQLGDLIGAFDFTQTPLPPLILDPCPPTTLTPKPKPGCYDSIALHTSTWGDT